MLRSKKVTNETGRSPNHFLVCDPKKTLNKHRQVQNFEALLATTGREVVIYGT